MITNPDYLNNRLRQLLRPGAFVMVDVKTTGDLVSDIRQLADAVETLQSENRRLREERNHYRQLALLR